MRIALQLHKADPKYAELEVALEMVSAAALAYRHIRHFIPLLIQHLPTGAWKWEVLLAFACPSRVPWLVGCNRRMPDTGSRLAGLAPGALLFAPRAGGVFKPPLRALDSPRTPCTARGGSMSFC